MRAATRGCSVKSHFGWSRASRTAGAKNDHTLPAVTCSISKFLAFIKRTLAEAQKDFGFSKCL